MHTTSDYWPLRAVELMEVAQQYLHQQEAYDTVDYNGVQYKGYEIIDELGVCVGMMKDILLENEDDIFLSIELEDIEKRTLLESNGNSLLVEKSQYDQIAALKKLEELGLVSDVTDEYYTAYWCCSVTKIGQQVAKQLEL